MPVTFLVTENLWFQFRAEEILRFACDHETRWFRVVAETGNGRYELEGILDPVTFAAYLDPVAAVRSGGNVLIDVWRLDVLRAPWPRDTRDTALVMPWLARVMSREGRFVR